MSWSHTNVLLSVSEEAETWLPFFHSSCNKTVIRFGFCEIQNNQGLVKGYQPKLTAEADNAYLDRDYSGFHKNLIQELFITTLIAMPYLQYRSKVSWHSKLEPRDLILEPRCSKRLRIESRVSSLESQGSSLEVRETRLSRICKNSKGFRGNDLFLEGRIIHCTILLTPRVPRSFSHENIRPYDSGLNVIFFGENLCSKLNVDLQSTMETYR